MNSNRAKGPNSKIEGCDRHGSPPAATTIKAAVTSAAIEAVCDDPPPNGAYGRRAER